MTTERKQAISRITHNTVIPLSLVFVLGSAMFWLSKISFTAETNRASIDEMKKDLKRIDRTMATIEGLLKGGTGG